MCEATYVKKYLIIGGMEIIITDKDGFCELHCEEDANYICILLINKCWISDSWPDFLLHLIIYDLVMMLQYCQEVQFLVKRTT